MRQQFAFGAQDLQFCSQLFRGQPRWIDRPYGFCMQGFGLLPGPRLHQQLPRQQPPPRRTIALRHPFRQLALHHRQPCLAQPRQQQRLSQAHHHRLPLRCSHLLSRRPLLLRLHKRQRRLLLLLAHIRARLDRLQQRHPVAQPFPWVVALQRVRLDHRLPVAPLKCLAAHGCVLPCLGPS